MKVKKVCLVEDFCDGAQQAGICEGWEIDFRPPGYLKLNL
jgi:hypothetical protein